MLVSPRDMLHLLEQHKKIFITTKIENITGLFLPSKNITKSRAHKEFLAHNQRYVLREDENTTITITGRLLTQKHKDVLESLFANIRGNGEFNLYKDAGFCQIAITPYKMKKAYSTLSNAETKSKWIYDKLVEISNCGVEILFKQNNDRIHFTFIDSVYQNSEGLIIINFSQSYTYFLAKTMLLEYKDYLKAILEFSNFCKRNINQIRKREAHTEPIKAILRFMLSHKGNNSQYKIEQIFNQLQFQRTLSNRQLNEIKQDLKEESIKDYLLKNFGISLNQNSETLSFKDSLTNNSKQILLPQETDSITHNLLNKKNLIFTCAGSALFSYLF